MFFNEDQVLVMTTTLFICPPPEFEALTRLGIPDPVNYIKKRFKSSNLLFLRSACVGQALVDQLEASVEEAVNSATWTDLQVWKVLQGY